MYSLKNTNGMFYYALDYLNEIKNIELEIWIDRNLANSLPTSCYYNLVIIDGLVDLIFKIMTTTFNNSFMFTPTPHPIPFLSNQCVIVHDSYPFNGGAIGKFKFYLLKLSIMSSKCIIGYINYSECKVFVDKICKDINRQFYFPNKFPEVNSKSINFKKINRNLLRVGLFGTDSTKKNYELLFQEVVKSNEFNHLKFCIYGHKTDYFLSILEDYPLLNIQLYDSDEADIDSFCNCIDVVVSVTKLEGFGRLIAYSLLHGINCFLIDSEVFREFFYPGALFFDNIKDILNGLINYKNYGLSSKVYFRPNKEIVDSFNKALKFIASKPTSK